MGNRALLDVIVVLSLSLLKPITTEGGVRDCGVSLARDASDWRMRWALSSSHRPPLASGIV